MKIFVINGPNLNRLGKREVNIYGDLSLGEINKKITEHFKNQAEICFFQSNDEGEIISVIGEADEKYDAIVINPAAYSHYSVAILDALKGISIPSVEVHLSNIYKREDFRKISVTANAAIGVISGLGWKGYILAIEFLLNEYKDIHKNNIFAWKGCNIN